MRTHVRFYKGGTHLGDDPVKRQCQVVPGSRIFDQPEIMCRLTFSAAHHDDPVIRKPHPFSESEASSDVGYDRVREVRVERCMVPDKFQPGRSIDQDDNFALERAERNIGVRPKATFASQSDLKVGHSLESRLNLGACCIELRSGPLNIPAKGAEGVCVQPSRDFQPQAQKTLDDRRHDLFLGMHRRQERAVAAIEESPRCLHQK